MAAASSSTRFSTPFVKIQEGHLALVGDLRIPATDPRIRVISILGKARMGKSTLLNSIVSFLTQQDVAPFQTQDDDEHCTRGIDSYYLEKHGLVLLDCQGLALEDSSHDPALLLFAYLVSDIIIFNERMMLQNEALKLLEPVCTFMTYIDAETIKKPKLFFRISDGDIVKTPAKNLEKVLATYKDQYQSIRDSIKHLFNPEIGIVKTETLDRSTKAALSAGKYLALLAEKAFGFEEAIKTVLTKLPAGRSAAEWLRQIPEIIKSINTNSKISIDKLDLVSQTAKLELMEWMNAIPSETFAEIVVDATQATFEANVDSRKNVKKNLLSSFTRKFKHIAAEIKDPYYRQLDERLTKLITAATEKTHALASAAIAPVFERCAAARTLGTLTNIFYGIDSVAEDPHKMFHQNCSKSGFRGALFGELFAQITSLYTPVRQQMENWLKDQFAKVEEALKKVADMERLESNMVKEYCDIAPNFSVDITKENLYKSHKSIITEFINAQLAQAAKQIRIFISAREIVFEMNESRWIQYHINILPFQNLDHPLIRQAYTKYVETLKALYENKDVHAAISTAKQSLLNKHVIPYAVTTHLKDESFVAVITTTHPSAIITHPSAFITTTTTFHAVILPVLRTMFEHLEAKKYLKADSISEYVLPDKKEGNITVVQLDHTKINSYLRGTFFAHQFGKALMRAGVGGAELPTDLPSDMICSSLPAETELSVPWQIGSSLQAQSSVSKSATPVVSVSKSTTPVESTTPVVSVSKSATPYSNYLECMASYTPPPLLYPTPVTSKDEYIQILRKGKILTYSKPM